MNCLIPQRSIKTFSRAIAALSRIGEELYLEFSPNQMILRAVSQSKSAYGSFVFDYEFFSEYRSDSISHGRRSKGSGISRLKMQMRTVLNVFKSAHTCDRQVESCGLEVDLAGNRVRFSFNRKSKVIHRHSVEFMDCDPLYSSFSKKHTKSYAVASAKLLTDTIENFPPNIDEITFSFRKDSFIVNNYMGDTPDPKQTAQMQIQMDIEEFENYSIQEETSVTITLKELKGVVSFISSVTYQSDVHGTTGLPVSIHFTGPGTPVLICIEVPNQYEANVTIATLEITPQNTQSASQSQHVDSAALAQNTAAPQTAAPPVEDQVPFTAPQSTLAPVRPAATAESATSVESRAAKGASQHQEPIAATPRVPLASMPPPVIAKESDVVVTQKGPTSRAAAIVFGLLPSSKRSSQHVAERILASDTEPSDDDDEDEEIGWSD
ncbi:cell cycle checkpoint control protein RAD9A-like [Paramacrobiotus metropolitanus]|uniref:cell cycle checkpoint control protein RAD9A-like n=1 Tax=Paramacrobiotus metropolitanus TaxID=2943436 RepID=UPI00244636A3|nr:cell cycle checkpoint control protein RAD9A-like [Paramacrobiotus metropolitanus]XP_055344134.1 cell cycle checkpoint control protein RAD9A-like [Paramacrobiotus metropolitanus]XP_055344142.1 cell cycle checkpoint control protein RAD9A-like [Paramacrobiotus metropolitanus]XP_055344147.1 cell cycle checkpoint control protein RAD9A-like [Paramacrobiotus metropolitanus]